MPGDTGPTIMTKAPQTLAEALEVIRSMHNDLLAFRNPEFDLITPGREGEFDDRVRAVLAHSAPVFCMTTHDQAIEAQIQAKGLTAPRVTPADIDEKAARDSEISRLAVFIDSNPVFPQLPADEQARLRRQLDVMRELSVILGERIANF